MPPEKKYYQEVIDAIASGNNDPRLLLLSDLCVAVDSDKRPVASRAIAQLIKSPSRLPPFDVLSANLFEELMARVLLAAWPFELTHLLDWYERTTPSLRGDETLIANWAGLLSKLPEPSPSRDLEAIATNIRQYRDALEIALAHLSAITASPPIPPPVQQFTAVNQAPPPPPVVRVTLESQLMAAVEQIFRQFNLYSQQLLELAIEQLEYDRSSHFLRRLQRFDEQVEKILRAQYFLSDDKTKRAISLSIRVMEIRPRKRPTESHRFLDAFTPHTARTVEFAVYNRLDNNPPQDWRGPMEQMHQLRERQLINLLDVYGEPPLPGSAPSKDNLRRRKLIEKHYQGRLTLRTDEDIAEFLAAFFKAIVRELTATPLSDPLIADPLVAAQVIAWDAALTFLDGYLRFFTAHTKFNIAEGPKSYLEMVFPRSLMGGVVHDCGVYATRLAYILLHLAHLVERTYPHCFNMQVSWILLPLHVGLLVRNKLRLLVVHNDSLFPFSDNLLNEMRDDWENDPSNVADPTDPEQRLTMFLEDLAAVAFNPDVDMPLVRMVIAGPGTLVSKDLVWRSYMRLMREDRLFSRTIENPRVPEFQFDLRFLQAASIQRDWENRVLVPAWNVKLRKAWEEALPGLKRDFSNSRDDYIQVLEQLLADIGTTYMDTALKLKAPLSDLVQRRPGLVQPKARIVRSERLQTYGKEIGPLQSVREHIEKLKSLTALELDPETGQPVTPIFARDDGALSPAPL
jgi:hypothetical protein